MMTPTTKSVFLQAITPLHCGTGQAASIVDLPVAREKTTGWPIVPATSLKGVLAYRYSDCSWAPAAFGAKLTSNEEADALGNAGALCFTDLRILCLPVRSYYGTFAYVTSHLVLSRFVHDGKAIGASDFVAANVPEVNGTHACVCHDSVLKHNKDEKDNIYLEDLDLEAHESQDVEAIAKAIEQAVGSDDSQKSSTFKSRFVIVGNEVFDHLCETATEVTARVALEEDTKTVRQGGLWWEEAVPAEAIFTGWIVDTRGDSLANVDDQLTLQIGGNASVGRGLCRMVVR